jgi:hypothetical protein
MFANKTTAEHGKYWLFIAKTGNIYCCSVQKHDPKTVCRFLLRTLGLLWLHVLWRTTVNTCAMILPCLVQNNWPNFISEHSMFFPMFGHQTFVNACSGSNLGGGDWGLVSELAWQEDVVLLTWETLPLLHFHLLTTPIQPPSTYS